MDREILFRGKSDKYGWVIGCLLYDKRSYNVDIIDNTTELVDYSIVEDNSFTVIHDTIGQYTNLIDKDGQKIFDGDIVEFKASYCPIIKPSGYLKGVVFWDVYKWSIKIKEVDQDGEQWIYDFYEEVDEYIKVIGNVFDNPKLIE